MTVELDRITNSIPALAGVVCEARIRMRHGEPRFVRVVVGFDTADDAALFEQIVLEAGATMEIVPSTLARGITVPANPVCFSVPATVGRALLALG